MGIVPGDTYAERAAAGTLTGRKDSTAKLGGGTSTSTSSVISTSGALKPEPWKAVRIRNDFTNPRAATATGWTGATLAGANPTNVTTGVGSGDASLGTYFFAKADYPGAFTLHEVQWAWAAAVGVPMAALAGVQQIVYHRATAKLVSGPPGVHTLRLWSITQDAGGANGRTKVVASKTIQVGDVVTLEGFDLGIAANARTGAMFALDGPAGSGASTVELRVSKAQVVVDPETECPDYCDGTVVRCSWDGAADASTSQGVATRVDLKRSFTEWGFAGNAQFGFLVKGGGERPLWTPTEEAQLLSEAGATMIRLGTDITGLWPLGQAAPNWRAASVKWFADYMDALRDKGIRACPIVGVPMDWMTTDNVQHSLRTLKTSSYDDFAKITTSMIAEWPDVITAVEYYNEPNFTAVWGATPDPVLFTTQFKAFAQRVKAAYPTVTIAAPALARYMGTDNTIGTGYDTFLTSFYANGGGPFADVISCHPYSWETTSADTAIPPATAGYTHGFGTILNTTRSIMNSNGDSAKKIWVTENGGNTDNGGAWSERRLAQYNMLCRTLAAHRGDVGAYFTHTFLNTFTQPVGQRGYGQFDVSTGRRRLTWFGQARGRMPGGDWVNVPMVNGWVPYNATKPGLQYRFNLDGSVSVRGEVKSGSAANAVMGVLPVHPAEGATVWRVGTGNNAGTYVVALMQVNADGSVFAVAGGSVTVTAFEFSFTPAN